MQFNILFFYNFPSTAFCPNQVVLSIVVLQCMASSPVTCRCIASSLWPAEHPVAWCGAWHLRPAEHPVACCSAWHLPLWPAEHPVACCGACHLPLWPAETMWRARLLRLNGFTIASVYYIKDAYFSPVNECHCSGWLYHENIKVIRIISFRYGKWSLGSLKLFSVFHYPFIEHQNILCIALMAWWHTLAR